MITALVCHRKSTNTYCHFAIVKIWSRTRFRWCSDSSSHFGGKCDGLARVKSCCKKRIMDPSCHLASNSYTPIRTSWWMQLQTLELLKFGSEQFQTTSNLAAITSFSEMNLFHASKRSMPQDLHASYLTHSVALRVSLEKGKHQGFPNFLYGFIWW